MKKLSNIKFALIALTVFLGIVYALPNFFDKMRNSESATFMPGKAINLGLDLKGGSYLLLKAEMDVVFAEKLETLKSDLRTKLRKNNIGYKKLNIKGYKLSFEKRNLSDDDKIKKTIFKINKNLIINQKGNLFIVTFSDLNKKTITKSTMNQAIEIVRRRIDETGTNEPSIQQQGVDRIIVQLPGLEDQSRI